VIVIRCAAPPTIWAALTPSTSSMSGMTRWARTAWIDSSSSYPDTASWITGKSSMLAVITWGSTPSGSEPMRLIACVIFCSAVARSVP
jgi:hypothetical protein